MKLPALSRLAVDVGQSGIATVKFNRPSKLNAVDMQTFVEVREVCRSLAKNANLRAVVVTGEGSDFSTGLDIKSVFSGSRASAFVKLLIKSRSRRSNLAQSICTAWRDIPVPVIAAIHGRCWGAGMQAALGADIRIAHPDAQLCLMEARWGLVPDCGGVTPLSQLVRYDIATQLVVFGQQVSGAEAEAIGLVTSTADDPLSAALSVAESALTVSPDAAAGGKGLLRIAYGAAEGATLSAETSTQARILAHPKSQNVKVAAKRAAAAAAVSKGVAASGKGGGDGKVGVVAAGGDDKGLQWKPRMARVGPLM